MKVSRRYFLATVSAAALMCGRAKAWIHGTAGAPSPPWDPTIVSVFEVTAVAPDVLCVEVRDGMREVGNIEIGGSSFGTPGTIGSGTNPGTGVDFYIVLNLDGKVRRWFDKRSTQLFNITAGVVAGDYGTIGGRTVTQLYQRSEPYDMTLTELTGPVQWLGGGFSHYLYLKLSSNLTTGNYTVTFPAGTGLSPYPFTYNDKTTRAQCIVHNQNGHRQDDVCKWAYLQQFLPGLSTNHGSIKYDTDYSVSTFNIIDSTGMVVFTGPVIQFSDPTTSYGSNRDYTDTSFSPFVATAITKANPGVVTYSGTGWGIANGDKVRFADMSGMTQLETQGTGTSALAYTVSNLNTGAKTFEINQNTTAFGTLTTGTYFSPTVENAIWKTYSGNAGGVYVYLLDYSTWTGAADGTYYIQIPGIGVSYPFPVNDNVYYNSSKVHCGGYYNQSSGRALDGRFGYTRPINNKDGQNGVEINFSLLPAGFASEWAYAANLLPSSDLGSATFQTANRVNGLGGEFLDAGDWDCAAVPHGINIHSLLDTYQNTPSAKRDVQFGYPLSTTIDPTFYAGTDFMGDAVHQSIWWLQFYLATLQPDNSVASGLGFSNGLGATGMQQPSCYNYHTTWLYAADPPGAFAVAGVCAKMSTVMYDAFTANPSVTNLQTLGAYYLATAKAIYAWAAKVWQLTGVADWVTATFYPIGAYVRNSGNIYICITAGTTSGGPSGTSSNITDGTAHWAYFEASFGAADANFYYNSVLNLQTNAAWSGAQYTAALLSMNTYVTAQNINTYAAAAIFRATCAFGTPDTAYITLIEAKFALNTTSWAGHAVWDYCQANYSSATHTTQRNYYFGLSGHGWNPAGVAGLPAPNTASYYGVGPAIYSACIDAQRSIVVATTPGFTNPTAVDTIYSAMQGYSCYWKGANQKGWSFTSGLGSRSQRNMLVQDRWALALPDMIPGITAYSILTWPQGGSFNWTTPNGSNFTGKGNTNSDAFSLNKTMNVPQYAYHYEDGSIDNQYFIFWSEFTVEQTMLSMQVWDMWLNAR